MSNEGEKGTEKVWTEAEWTPEADMLSQIADNLEANTAQLTRIADLMESFATVAGEYIAKMDKI